MKNKAVPALIVMMLLISSVISVFNLQPAKSQPTTWTVDDDKIQHPSADFVKIQDAINAANASDTIIVYNGIYIENIIVNKSLTLIGQNKFFTIVDGNRTENVFRITASNVTIKSFTIRNSGENTTDMSGIFLSKVINTVIHDNILTNNMQGIHLRSSSNNTKITDNMIIDNQGSGIRLADNSNLNTVVSDELKNNKVAGIEIHTSSNNTFYRNNIINNTQYQVQVLGGVDNIWDNNVEGNYWNDYNGKDLNGDGIGDTNTPFWTDYKPLIEPWSQKRIYQVNVTHAITVESNFTIASFQFNQALNRTNFRITGPADWQGFCNITIPKAVVNVTTDIWRVFAGGINMTSTTLISENTTHTWLYFNGTIAGKTAWIFVKSKLGNPPIADFEHTPTTPSILDTIDFIDTSFDPDGTIQQWQWSFGDNSTSNSTNPQHKYDAYNDTYRVTLTVWDIDNLNATTSKTVLMRNLPPTITAFSISPASVIRGSAVNITVNGEDVEGLVSVINVKITAPDMTEYDYSFANTTFANVTFSTQRKPTGTYTVDAEVKDHKGLSATESGTFEVVLPSSTWLVADFNFNPTAPRVGEPVNFEDKSVDLGGEIVSWFWDFGDGTNATSQSPMHSYAHIGDYYATLIVNDLGFENSTTRSITVTKMGTNITIYGSSSIKAGNPAIIYARLEDSLGQPLIGKNVTFHLSGGALEKEMSRLTNAFGNATILEYLLMSGTYNISARFEGNADYYGSNANWAFIVNALNTSISLPSLINATQQKPVILSATLKDENNLPIKQVSVTFYIYNGTGWEEIGSSQTNDAGVANLEYSPLDAGTYQLLAVFEGNGMYLGSNATSTLKVNAKPSDINYILYVVAGVFILFAVIVFIKISRRRR